MKKKTAGGKTAGILTIGNEITSGKITDTNSSFIAAFLHSRGYAVPRILSVGDDAAEIAAAVRGMMKKADLVVVTGGLGPTHDDITKKVMCRVFDCGTKWNPAVYRQVRGFFRRRKLEMPESNRDYAFIPEAAVPVKNGNGVAPGLFFAGKVLVLPGVPREAEEMLSNQGPRLIPPSGMFVRERTLHTAGIGEPRLAEKIDALDEAAREAEVAFLPHGGWVSIRIVARDSSAARAAAKLKKAERLIRKNIEEHIWGTGEETMAKVVLRLLEKNGATLSMAESCTGGAAGAALTDIPGSSRVFAGGITAYSNEIKEKHLGVHPKVLKRFGAVSGPAALAMAIGVREKFGTDYAVSITGIAGPGGGTKEKPVGLVYIALAGPDGEACGEMRLAGSRRAIRERAVFETLYLLYRHLSGHPS